ncbi:hypothetical protein CTAM01_00387, partial [Colletotrichum tamarilloi]
SARPFLIARIEVSGPVCHVRRSQERRSRNVEAEMVVGKPCKARKVKCGEEHPTCIKFVLSVQK